MAKGANLSVAININLIRVVEDKNRKVSLINGDVRKESKWKSIEEDW